MSPTCRRVRRTSARDVWLATAGHGRPELRPKGQQREHALVRFFRDELSEKFQRRGIRPVQILDHEQDRLTTSMSAQPLSENGQCLFALPER